MSAFARVFASSLLVLLAACTSTDPAGERTPPASADASAPATSTSDANDVLAVAARHPRWRTLTFSTKDLDPYPKLAAVSTITKLWKPDVRADGSVRLVETTALSPVPRTPLASTDEWREKRLEWLQAGTFAENTKWGSESVELSADAIDVFALDIATLEPAHVELRVLSDDRIELVASTDEGPVSRVVLVPDDRSEAERLPRVDVDFDAYHYPLVDQRFLEQIEVLPKPIPQNQGVLRHDLRRTRKVRLDKSFPPAFEGSVEKALAEWNAKGFQKDFFVLDRSDGTEPIDCLTSRDLICIYWSGGDKVSWLMGGVTNLTFAPDDGALFGGTITIENAPAGQVATKATPPELASQYAARSFPLPALAGYALDLAKLASYAHPEPEKLIEYVLLHELGHASGLPHYFASSNGGTQGAGGVPSDTVMEYLPSPLWTMAVQLGARDIRKMDAIHRGIPAPPEMRCGDFDVLDNPTCRTFDFGDPAEWYVTMAELRPSALFSVIPSEGGADRYLDQEYTVADRLIALARPNQWTTEAQRSRAHDYLCLRKTDATVATKLDALLAKSYPSFDLACP